MRERKTQGASGDIRSRGCAVSQQIVNSALCFARDFSQLISRRRMNAIHPVGHRRLTHTDAFRKCQLGRLSALKIGGEGLHKVESIGLPYDSAIGSSYGAFAQNWRMPKLRDRTFLERALEALKERYPRERATQTRLAKIAGVSQPAVHEWGLPNRAPEHSSVLKLAKELNVCVEWLYTERGAKHPQATPEEEPFLQDWSRLDEETKRQVARYTEFLRGSSTRQ